MGASPDRQPDVCHTPWFWEIKQSGGGPHYYLFLEFDTTPDDLEHWFAPLLVPHYDRSELKPYWCSKQGGEWLKTTVELEANCLIVTRTWGHDWLDDEAFLKTLGAPNAPNLKRWQVSAGGEGYRIKSFASGFNILGFQNYCCQRN